MKNFRIYVLATFPLIAFFAYQILAVLPRRPETPDIAHGFTISLALDDGGAARYVSALDCFMTFGPIVVASIIIAVGLWRGGALSRKK